MAVTNNFSASTLDLNGVIGLSQPTALEWGPDGRLYVTEVDGDVKVLTIEFGDPDPGDADPTAQFYVTDAVLVSDVKSIQNFNDNGTTAPQNQRQVTGIDVTAQYDANGDPMTLPDGTPMVTMYVTSSDNRIGAGGSGEDAGLDTNSGVITKLTQTGPDTWDAVDIVRGLARSEENHATNGLEVIQEFDEITGKLVSERMIVSSGGNANTGAPSNNFAGQQEQPYSGALLEVDLDAINALTPVLDPVTNRLVAYDLPTLNDPLRPGEDDDNDPFGGNDGLNSAKLTADSPVQIYSAGYRNAYDVEVTDDGRVFTYDNGANNIWGGRPIGEPNFLDSLYIALNLNNGDGNVNDDINDAPFDPLNFDSLHEATRSDDLEGRELSAGKGGPQTYDWDYGNGEGSLQLVYGGHPNPTRAEGARAGLLFSPEDGTENAFLMVANTDNFGNDGVSDYDEVIAWLTEVENNDTDYPSQGVYGAAPGDLTKKVIEMTPGVAYDIYLMPDGSAEIRLEGTTDGLPVGGTYIGTSGLPEDIGEIVHQTNAIEGNYLEAGVEDGSLDSGKGSVNGLTEYTSTILDDGDTKMSGALLATSLNQGQIYVIGRDENGVVQTNDAGATTQAADRTTLQAGGGPLGIATLGDDVIESNLAFAFTGSIWVATFNQNGPLIEVFQPEGVGLPLAGADIFDEEDNDLDGVKDIDDPFEYSPENGYQLGAGETIEIDFNPQNTNFPISLSGTGLLGAALDGVTANQDARTLEEGTGADQVQDGLFDNGGNILPGGNAPILKIKTVVDGSVVGGDNDARDVVHTGFRPDPEVDRISLTMSTANWIPARLNDPVEGQLSGMMFGDGTQFNFLRVVYGGVDGGIGFEVGVEIGDTNYQKLATVLVPELDLLVNDVVDIQMIIDQGNNFAVEVGYRFGTEGDFISIPLNNGAGYSLPPGVLQNVLNGTHTVQSAGGPELPSGAAVGFLAEDVPGGDLTDVDFFGLKIESLPNELVASNAAEVGQQGTDGADVVVYDGTDTELGALDASVEDFDGSQSAADYNISGNAGDNTFKLGLGANTVTTGEGADSIQGTKAQLDGDTITDFTSEDEVIINGVTVNDITVGFEVGSAVVVIDGDTRITFDGPDFADFQAEDGNDIFEFESVAGGVRLITKDPLTPVVAINAGGDAVPGLTLREQTVDFVSDAPSAPKTGFTVTGDYKAYSSDPSNAFDYPGTDLDDVLKNERSSASEANWGYAIDVPNGNYLVDLIYAEIFHDLTGNFGDPAGKREFDVFIEGNQVEDNFDIIDDAGASGTQVIKTYQVTVTDGSLEIEFNKEVDQAKLSGLVVWAVGGNFEPPADETAPEIESIIVENPPNVQDGPRDAIVTLTDNAGFEAADFAGLDGTELVFTGIEPSSVGAPTVEISTNGQTATLTYELQPPTDTNAWPTGQGQVSIAAGAFGDAAGNTTAAADAVFFVEPNLDNLVAGNVALAINVGETTNTIDNALAGDDKNTYGGAITGDTIINGIDLQADDPNYYSPTTKTGSNIDGKFGPTGSNPALDGSALHTYRDAASGSFTATYPIANGIYVVELWFAELFHSTAGNRQGDYTINGEELAMNFDAFTEAGAADTAVKITKNVVVTNGEIVIDVNADTGEPGFNAIVVYDAVPSDLPPTVSVADVATAEGEDASITFSRVGDLSEDVTVEYTLTDLDTDPSDYGTATPETVTILAGQTSATVTLPIVDDEDEEAAESLTVSITSVSNTSNDAVISATGGSATVTIAASDPSSDLPDGGPILSLDFETAGNPLVEGGFDTVLGGPTALEAEKISVADGKLVVITSQGDLSNTPTDASKNDLVAATDLSDAGLNDIIISTAFDNPFTDAYLTSIGATAETIPNFKQQGIIIATADPATNQNADQFMKVVYGGGSGTQTQMWSQGSVDQPVKLTDVSAAAAVPFVNSDVARIEMALVIDKAAGTIAQFVTYFDDGGAVLGGVRPEAIPGFATAAPVAIPAALLAAINNGTSVVGVTSTDFGGPVEAADSFPATWDYLNVTSPQVAVPDGPDAVGNTLYVDFSDDGLAPTDVGALENGSNVVVAQQVGDDNGALGRDRDYFTFEVPEGQVLTAINVTGFENQEPTDTAGFVAIQEGTQIATDPVTGAGFGDLLGGAIYTNGDDILNVMSQGGDVQGTQFLGFDLPLEAGDYTIWLNQGADLPTTVTLDFVLADRPADVTLSIADAGDVVENGDFGVTVLGFELTASDSFDGTLTVTYDTANDTGLTQDVTFVGGVGLLTVLVDNDDVDDGADPVSVTLTSAVDAIGTETVGIVSGSESGNGSVTEDDGPAGVTKGAVALAVNVNGPEVTTTDGVTYEADDAGAWVGSTLYTDGQFGQPAVPNGDFDRDGDADADDALYTGERFGGAGEAVMTYTRMGLAEGEYILTLKFAELFNSNIAAGSRVFSVIANGEEVVTDLDLGTIPDLEADQAYDIDVPVTIGADGVLTLGFDASADNAKINAFALYEAVNVTTPTDVTVSVADITAEEDSGAANVIFTRDGDTTSDVVVTFAVADGTGVAGVDYETPLTTTVTILAGETTATLPVTLIDNAEDSVDVKDFTVTITDVAPAGGESASVGQSAATVTIDDDEDFDPADIDADGIANAIDPFAYDGDNGAGKVLGLGDSFRQDFDVDTTDVFSAEGGFTGIVVNTAGFNPPGQSATDPYGDRTTEATSLVEGGVLKITSSEEDLFATGTGANNVVRDNYISAVDVTGVNEFVIQSKVANPFDSLSGGNFKSIGIIVGAGGTDDYLKFVVGAGGSGTGTRAQFAQEDSTTSAKETNIDVTQLAADFIFRLEFNKSSTAVGFEGQPTVSGTVTLLDDLGATLETIDMGTHVMTGSLLAAVNGTNPLTGGTGGLAYGVSITDVDFAGDAAANRFVGEWDYLEISAPDYAPTVDAGIAAQAATEDQPFSFEVPADAFADDGGVENLTLTATLANGDPLPAWLIFDGTTFSGTPANADANGVISITVSADDGTNPPTEITFDLDVANVNDAPTAAPIAVPSALETDGPVVIELLSDAAAADEDNAILGVINVSAETAGGDPVLFDLDGQTLTIDPAQFADALDGGDSVAVTVTYTITDNVGGEVVNTATLLVGGVDGPFTWYVDADGDGFGTDLLPTIEANTQPEGYALQAGDRDDNDNTIYPDAPEINDGKDNDQDDAVDEDNTDPTAVEDRIVFQPEQPLEVNVSQLLTNDTDLEGDVLTLESITDGTGGTVALNEGVITFTPDENFNGQGTFSYTIIDGFGGSATTTVTLAVENRIVVQDNTPPEGTDGIDVVQFDGAGDLDLSDPDIEDLDLSGNTNNGGTVTLNDGDNNVQAGTGKQTVNLGTGGADKVSGTAEQLDGDTFGDFDEQDSITVEDGAGTTIVSRTNGSAVIGLDTDGDGMVDKTITLSGDIDPSTVVLTEDGEDVMLTLDENAAPAHDLLENDGILILDLAAGEGEGVAIENVDVMDANGDPVAFTQDGGEVSIDPSQFAQDLDGGESIQVTVTYEVSDNGDVADRSTAFVVGGIDGPIFWYRDADNDTYGDDEDAILAYEAPDGYVERGGDADDTDGTIYPDAPELNDGKDNNQNGQIDEANEAPVLGADGGETAVNQPFVITRAELLSNDTDANLDSLTIDGVSNPVNGTVEFDTNTGVVTFTPADGFIGTASFDYTVSDGFGGVTLGTVSVEVVDGVGQISTPLPLTQAGIESYSPQDDLSESDYTVNEAEQTILLEGNTWKRIELPEGIEITESTELWFKVKSDAIPEILGIGLDTDNSIAASDQQALFQLGGDGGRLRQANRDYETYDTPGEEVMYKLPLGEYAGVDFTHLVFFNDQDANPGSIETGFNASSMFSEIRLVEPSMVNAAPVAVEDAKLMEADETLVISVDDLLDNDSDADGDALTVISVGNFSNGTAVLENGLITFTVDDPDYSGPASFEYTIADPDGATSTTTVNISVFAPGTGNVVTGIDFNASPIQSYQGQDARPGAGFEISPEGDSLTLEGNVWKRTDLAGGDYTVTENTVLRLDLTVLVDTVEILAIGLENDNTFVTDDDAIFQLHGSQNFGGGNRFEQSSAGLYETVGQPTSYEISLADWAGQSFSSLVFINDDDQNGTAVSQFANVELVELLVVDPGDTESPQIFGGQILDQVVEQGEPLEFPLPFFDQDTPFEDLVFTLTNSPDFVSVEAGALVGTPTNADVGEYTIGVTATDPQGNATTGSFTLTVENVNDAPQVVGAYDDVNLVINNEIVLPLPDGLFVDIDAGAVLNYSATGLPEGLTIDPESGAITGTPTEGGDYEVTITASDGPDGDPDTLSASTTFTIDIASGPPRETVLIEAEDFTGFDDPATFEGFFKEFAGAASGNELIRTKIRGEGFVSTDLDAAGVSPGFYDISVIHFDENDGESEITLKLDLGDDAEPTVIGTFVMDQVLPGQGGTTQSANIASAVFPTVNIPAGAQLIIEAIGSRGEPARIDAVRFDPIDNTPPTISTAAEATVDEGTLFVTDVDATDLEGSEVSYAIVGGADAALFDIDPVTGEVSFIEAPDAEAPLDENGDNIYDVVIAASDGDVASEQALVITVASVDEAPEFSSETTATVSENDTAAATVAAADPEAAAITYAIAGTGADDALFAVDETTGVVTFLAAPDFEALADANGDNVYEVSVTASDGTLETTTDLQITVEDVNDAPEAVADPAAQPAIVDAPLSLSIIGLFSDQDGDALTYALISGAPAGITGVDLDGNLVGTPTEIGAFDVIIEASDGVETVQATLPLLVDVADNTFGPVAPSQDLDNDLTVNALDDDVDGDGLLNEADSFAYDADNGTLLADGESIELNFDVNGTPYQNGFTGLLQAGTTGGNALADHVEETGAASVADGVLTVPTTTGDTGGGNDPEDDYQLGIKNADFTVEARVLNPFETTAPVSFDQIGIHVGLDSTDFVKFVFGAEIEFSTRTNDVEEKFGPSGPGAGNQPYPAGLTAGDFSSVDITLAVNSISPTAATVTALATFLDGNGDPLPGASAVNFGTATISGALAAALADETAGVGTGFTQVHAASSSSFDAQLDSFKVTATDGGSVDASNALAVFDSEDGIFTGNSYGANEVGSAVLEVMTGNNNIQSSNFGQDSFELTNTGDKNISAVFIDVSTALYQDSVFDPDGAGGDDAFKAWGINSGGILTGAEVSGGTGGYFLPGVDPIANNTGTGQASNGGFKGALIKFSDFDSTETVGFSGDMDPNSLAGLTKGGVDTNAINGWDAGGISGHEIIGSTFTILFDDGSTATGQLASDGSTAGSQGLATEDGFASDAPTLSVNGFGPGDVGTYGVTQPTILVTGTPGETVRITMTKGFNPVDNSASGIDALVEDRLERYDFKVNNAFDAQTVDLVIGADGTADATGLFDYDDTLSNGGSFPGSDVADIGFVASIVDPSQGNLPVSPVTTPIYLTNEGGPVEGDPVGNDGTNALEVFAGESDLDTSATYGDGVTGSAVLTIMPGVNDIDASNFGPSSFQVTNTGEKKISAVFIDVSDAIYEDAVFDPDGAGGDNVAKPWAVNSAGGTGAFITGGTGGYFLPGQDPLANTTGTGQASNGGYKGAIVKFTDFNTGETVGFSGDMDPNSIAGLLKSGVDSGATDGWDVGGVSGHELIGSRFTVIFDDGTTATGQLGSDGSASGSQALADQGLTKPTTPTLEVNGVAAGGIGTYGGTQPTIIVTGDVGDTVRITMTKGFNPVNNTANGIAQLVEDRLDRYDFKASNNFDSQSVDVVIGPDGTFDATGLFDYDDSLANDQADGTFAGDDVAQIGFVASVIDTSNNDLPISDMTAPIILSNEGGPVVGNPEVPIEGFYEIIGNSRFKIQLEDENSNNGGTPPGALWEFEETPDSDGRQAGFQGDGYFVFGSNQSTAIAGVSSANLLEYDIFIPDDAIGTFNFRFRTSRDGEPGIPGDQQNDLWLNFKKRGTDETIEEYLTQTANEAEPTSQGYIKVFNNATGSWGFSGTSAVDGAPNNFNPQIEVTEGGLYTVQIAGRSQGFHVDFFELYKGGAPGLNASDSAYVSDNPPDPDAVIVSSINQSSDDWEQFGGAGSGDLEFGVNGSPQYVGMRFTNIDIPADKAIAEAYFQFEANGDQSGPVSFLIEIEDTESAATYSAGSTPNDRTYLDLDFDWNEVEPWEDGETYRTPDISDLIEAAIGTDGVLDGDLGFRVTLADGSALNKRSAHTFDSSGDAPELVIVLEDDSIA